VHNERTYPNLLRLFTELNVETKPTEMSMSISCDGCGLAYAGGRGLAGILAQPRRAADPRFVRMLTEVPRFHRLARGLLGEGSGDGPTWGEFLAGNGFSEYFGQHFAVPLVACVWSAGDADARTYPARYLFEFLNHHGMLSVTGSPQWRTVVGGSVVYVDKIAAQLPDVRAGQPVIAVERHADGVDVHTADGAAETFDQAIVAVHADQAAAMLSGATGQERDDLAAIRYSSNPTWLHRDGSVLPSNRRARGAWNYRQAPLPWPTTRYWSATG